VGHSTWRLACSTHVTLVFWEYITLACSIIHLKKAFKKQEEKKALQECSQPCL
jgi:hypothetical protein